MMQVSVGIVGRDELCYGVRHRDRYRQRQGVSGAVKGRRKYEDQGSKNGSDTSTRCGENLFAVTNCKQPSHTLEIAWLSFSQAIWNKQHFTRLSYYILCTS
jgi:hypothetical protein